MGMQLNFLRGVYEKVDLGFLEMPCFCADFDLDSFAAHEVQFPLSCLVFYEVNVSYWSTVER